jgi:GNAT superfamily N-acetyltransferase
MKVRRLEAADDRSAFRSENADHDRFFHRFAAHEQFLQQIGTTYVAVDDTDRILGFATVIPSEIAGSPRTLPVLRLTRLAVARRAQGKGVGSQLVRGTVELALRIAQSVGCEGLVVDSHPDEVSFYEGLGLATLETSDRPGPMLMFLELASVPISDY